MKNILLAVVTDKNRITQKAYGEDNGDVLTCIIGTAYLTAFVKTSFEELLHIADFCYV